MTAAHTLDEQPKHGEGLAFSLNGSQTFRFIFDAYGIVTPGDVIPVLIGKTLEETCANLNDAFRRVTTHLTASISTDAEGTRMIDVEVRD